MENQFLDANLDATPQYGKYANFGQRLVAAIIDGIIMWVVQMIVYAIFGVSSMGLTQAFSGGDEETAAAAGLGMGVIFAYLLNVGIQACYYAYFESSEKQATFGKQAMGLVVTNLNGERISFANGIGRYFAKILSAITLLIGYLMQPFTEKQQALHDMIAGTLVYKK